MNDNSQACTEMPQYECHKRVWALKIASIELVANTLEGGEQQTAAMLYPVEDGFGPIEVDVAYMRRNNVQQGGYYVQYSDGYKSYSPAKAFEDGYSLIGRNA